jgi:hypothetical protein
MDFTGSNLIIFLNHLEYQLALRSDIDVRNPNSVVRTLFLEQTCTLNLNAKYFFLKIYLCILFQCERQGVIMEIG